MSDRLKFLCGVKVCCYSDDGEDKEVIIRFEPDTITKYGEVGFDLVFLMDKLKKLGLSKHELYTAKDFIICNYETSIEDWCIANPEYLVQCTGLKDKNGKLVYEGDIIKSTVYTINMKVVYCIEESFFGLKYPHNDDNRCSAAIPSSEEIEVIGNIHENPEFLNADNA